MAGSIDFNQILYQIQEQLNKIGAWVKNLPNTIKAAPQDEQIAYGTIGGGILFLVIGIILSIIIN